MNTTAQYAARAADALARCGVDNLAADGSLVVTTPIDGTELVRLHPRCPPLAGIKPGDL